MMYLQVLVVGAALCAAAPSHTKGHQQEAVTENPAITRLSQVATQESSQSNVKTEGLTSRVGVFVPETSNDPFFSKEHRQDPATTHSQPAFYSLQALNQNPYSISQMSPQQPILDNIINIQVPFNANSDTKTLTQFQESSANAHSSFRATPSKQSVQGSGILSSKKGASQTDSKGTTASLQGEIVRYHLAGPDGKPATINLGEVNPLKVNVKSFDAQVPHHQVLPQVVHNPSTGQLFSQQVQHPNLPPLRLAALNKYIKYLDYLKAFLSDLRFVNNGASVPYPVIFKPNAINQIKTPGSNINPINQLVPNRQTPAVNFATNYQVLPGLQPSIFTPDLIQQSQSNYQFRPSNQKILPSLGSMYQTPPSTQNTVTGLGSMYQVQHGGHKLTPTLGSMYQLHSGGQKTVSGLEPIYQHLTEGQKAVLGLPSIYQLNAGGLKKVPGLASMYQIHKTQPGTGTKSMYQIRPNTNVENTKEHISSPISDNAHDRQEVVPTTGQQSSSITHISEQSSSSASKISSISQTGPAIFAQAPIQTILLSGVTDSVQGSTGDKHTTTSGNQVGASVSQGTNQFITTGQNPQQPEISNPVGSQQTVASHSSKYSNQGSVSPTVLSYIPHPVLSNTNINQAAVETQNQKQQETNVFQHQTNPGVSVNEDNTNQIKGHTNFENPSSQHFSSNGQKFSSEVNTFGQQVSVSSSGQHQVSKTSTSEQQPPSVITPIRENTPQQGHHAQQHGISGHKSSSGVSTAKQQHVSEQTANHQTFPVEGSTGHHFSSLSTTTNQQQSSGVTSSGSVTDVVSSAVDQQLSSEVSDSNKQAATVDDTQDLFVVIENLPGISLSSQEMDASKSSSSHSQRQETKLGETQSAISSQQQSTSSSVSEGSDIQAPLGHQTFILPFEVAQQSQEAALNGLDISDVAVDIEALSQGSATSQSSSEKNIHASNTNRENHFITSGFASLGQAGKIHLQSNQGIRNAHQYGQGTQHQISSDNSHFITKGNANQDVQSFLQPQQVSSVQSNQQSLFSNNAAFNNQNQKKQSFSENSQSGDLNRQSAFGFNNAASQNEKFKTTSHGGQQGIGNFQHSFFQRPADSTQVTKSFTTGFASLKNFQATVSDNYGSEGNFYQRQTHSKPNVEFQQQSHFSSAHPSNQANAQHSFGSLHDISSSGNQESLTGAEQPISLAYLNQPKDKQPNLSSTDTLASHGVTSGQVQKQNVQYIQGQQQFHQNANSASSSLSNQEIQDSSAVFGGRPLTVSVAIPEEQTGFRTSPVLNEEFTDPFGIPLEHNIMPDYMDMITNNVPSIVPEGNLGLESQISSVRSPGLPLGGRQDFLTASVETIDPSIFRENGLPPPVIRLKSFAKAKSSRSDKKPKDNENQENSNAAVDSDRSTNKGANKEGSDDMATSGSNRVTASDPNRRSFDPFGNRPATVGGDNSVFDSRPLIATFRTSTSLITNSEGKKVPKTGYEFEYVVNESEKDDFHGHKETGEAGEEGTRASGSYFHRSPEGFTHEITYTADERGFRPSIRLIQ